MKKNLLILGLVLLLPQLGHATETDVQLIGIDEEGQTGVASVPGPQFERRMSTAVLSTHESTMNVLSKGVKNGRWMLRTVVVGLGVSAEVGLGPIIKLSAVPRFRLLFSNSKDPILP